MQTGNCPRCKMILAPGAQICPNCHLNLHQFAYQQQFANQFAQPHAPVETQKERTYRKLLIAFAIVMMSEFLIMQVPVYLGFYEFGQLTTWLDMLLWSGVPLIIALVLPKHIPGRVVLIVFAAIYILLRVLYAVWIQQMWYNY